MSDQINIEDLIDGAIIEGYRAGVATFTESLENELRNEAVIEECGSAQELLQGMIDYQLSESISEEASENVQNLGAKLGRLFR